MRSSSQACARDSCLPSNGTSGIEASPTSAEEWQYRLIMPMRIELWQNGSLVDGIEEWWDGVEAALTAAQEDYPILDSISPYGDLTLAFDRLKDLGSESRRLAESADKAKLRSMLLKISELCERARTTPGSELRFNGD